MKNIDRRNFLKSSLIAGVGLAILPSLAKGASKLSNATLPDIASITGTDRFQITIDAIEAIGGISKFIPRGSKVGLLINAPGWWTKPGSYTHTEVVLATVKLLNDAGVTDICYLIDPAAEFYSRSPLSEKYNSLTSSIKKCSGNFVEVDVPNAVKVKKAKVIKELLEVDKLINIPINKQHSGVMFTGCLKNMMGACSGDTNKTFHQSVSKDVEDVEYLAQCIVDINHIRKQDLCITDATEVLKTNGPFGPGEIAKLNKVFAGTIPVAMDAYGCTLLDYRPQDIRTTVLASEQGLGSYDLKKYNIFEKE
jgi:uncharacterized protein (DUF362 family)